MCMEDHFGTKHIYKHNESSYLSGTSKTPSSSIHAQHSSLYTTGGVREGREREGEEEGEGEGESYPPFICCICQCM